MEICFINLETLLSFCANGIFILLKIQGFHIGPNKQLNDRDDKCKLSRYPASVTASSL